MKTRVCILIFFLIGSFFPSAPGHGEMLVVRVTDWPPFYIEKNGEWSGLTIDAYKALLHEAGLPYVYKKIPWNRALKKMKTRPILMGHLTPLKERKKMMHFIGPHFNEVIGIAVKNQFVGEKTDSIDDIVRLSLKSGKKIGYLEGVYYSDEFNRRKENDSEFRKLFFNNSQNMITSIKMIAGDHLFGMMEEKVVLDYAIKVHGYHKEVVLLDYEFSKTPVYFGVSKTVSGQILEQLKKANTVLLANDTYQKLTDKWLNSKY